MIRIAVSGGMTTRICTDVQSIVQVKKGTNDLEPFRLD